MYGSTSELDREDCHSTKADIADTISAELLVLVFSSQVYTLCTRSEVPSALIFLITLAGLPTAMHRSGMSLVITLPAPIVTPLPILHGPITTTDPPIQQSLPMLMGLAHSGPLRPLRASGDVGWFGV
jgi:hypothetical protein